MFHLSSGQGKEHFYYIVNKLRIVGKCPNLPDRCSVDDRDFHVSNEYLFENREDIPPPDYEEICIEVYANYSKAARTDDTSELVKKGWRVKRQMTISYNPPQATLVMK